MIRYAVAICWAVAMLLLALMAKSGWVARDTAAFLLLILPALAYVTIQPHRGCGIARRTA